MMLQAPLQKNQLLAVNVGLSCGMAMYGPNGHLRWYRSESFCDLTKLRRAAGRLLASPHSVAWLISEGDVSLAAIWERIAMRQGVRVQRVSLATWQDSLLVPPPSQRLAALPTAACEAALATQSIALARRVISWSGGPVPATLQLEAAEAILIGLWGVMALGWLRAMPTEVPQESRYGLQL